jgi:hypothetical protein
MPASSSTVSARWARQAYQGDALPWGALLGSRILGGLLYASGWRRATTRSNVALHALYLGCGSAEAQRRIVRRSYEHVALVLVTLLGLPRLVS